MEALHQPKDVSIRVSQCIYMTVNSMLYETQVYVKIEYKCVTSVETCACCNRFRSWLPAAHVKLPFLRLVFISQYGQDLWFFLRMLRTVGFFLLKEAYRHARCSGFSFRTIRGRTVAYMAQLDRPHSDKRGYSGRDVRCKQHGANVCVCVCICMYIFINASLQSQSIGPIIRFVFAEFRDWARLQE